MARPTRSPDKAYWDACVFISLLSDYRDRRPDEIDGLRDTIARVEGGQLIIFTTHLWESEVLQSRAAGQGAKDRLSRLFQRRRCQVLFTDPKASKLANDLREHYAGKLDPMDSIHLATAIHNRIPVFHTYDNGKKGGINLLDISGNVAGRYTITICKPPATSAERWLPFEV